MNGIDTFMGSTSLYASKDLNIGKSSSYVSSISFSRLKKKSADKGRQVLRRVEGERERRMSDKKKKTKVMHEDELQIDIYIKH